jgi:hypothetical protein
LRANIRGVKAVRTILAAQRRQTMNKHVVPSPSDLHHVGELFSKIAELSSTLHEIADRFMGSDRIDHNGQKAACVREFVLEIAVTVGYLAEVGASKVGGSGFLESPDQWLLPSLPDSTVEINPSRFSAQSFG